MDCILTEYHISHSYQANHQLPILPTPRMGFFKSSFTGKVTCKSTYLSYFIHFRRDRYGDQVIESRLDSSSFCLCKTADKLQPSPGWISKVCKGDKLCKSPSEAWKWGMHIPRPSVPATLSLLILYAMLESFTEAGALLHMKLQNFKEGSDAQDSSWKVQSWQSFCRTLKIIVVNGFSFFHLQ